MVKVLDQRAHAFNLSAQILILLLLGCQIFSRLGEIVLEALPFILNQGQRLLQVDYL